MSPRAPRENREIIDREPGVLTKVGRHLNRHKGKYLLGLTALLGTTYGLGAAGQAGAFHDGGVIARNTPTWAQSGLQGLRNVSAQATRFNHVVDAGLQRVFPSAGFQTPTDANSALQIRDNIRGGTGPTRPHEIS